MSISSMASAALGRRNDFPGQELVPASWAGLVSSGPPPTEGIGSAGGPPQPEVPAERAGPTDLLHVVATYVPSEVVALYVAFCGAMTDDSASSSRPATLGEWIGFAAFLLATPLIVWVIFAGKLKGAGKPVPLKPKFWPMWEMFAATIAFAAWAYALPGGPFARQSDHYSPAIAGLMLLVVSTLIGLFAPLFQRRLASS